MIQEHPLPGLAFSALPANEHYLVKSFFFLSIGSTFEYSVRPSSDILFKALSVLCETSVPEHRCPQNTFSKFHLPHIPPRLVRVC